jgi:DDE superfamily endonuclease
VKQLSADTIKKRLAFCKANMGTVWKNVMFSDRKKFYFKYPGQVVQPGQWIKQGERRTAPKVNHPDAVNVYAAISVFGVTKVHFVAGTKGMDAQFAEFKNKKGQPPRNITSLQYKRVVDEFCKQGSQFYSAEGHSFFVLQQDNDPTHKKASAEAICEWNDANKQGCQVKLLANYPPNSPDLNPIENLWAYVQRKVDAAGCKNFTEFKSGVVKAIERAPKRLLKALIGSMKTRVHACIELKGGKTKY